jgi:hypothetical protein
MIMAIRPFEEGENPELTYVRNLLKNIEEGVLGLEENFRDLVRRKGWLAVGYESFAQLWAEEFHDTVVGRHREPPERPPALAVGR